MEDNSLSALIKALDTPRDVDRDAAWERIDKLDLSRIPYLADFAPKAKHWQCRASILTHLGRYSRDSESAFQAGLNLMWDKSKWVRYAACSLCAYSLNTSALPALRELLKHPDVKTAAYAAAAIDAIEHKNHHYFRDRDHSGAIKWSYALLQDGQIF